MILLHLPAGRHTAEVVRDALVEAMVKVPANRRRSLTWDQGKEMALHGEIAQALGMPVFFCEKSSHWQRPSNENTNGLLRQYFPEVSTCRDSPPATSKQLPMNSTADPASPSIGKLQPNDLLLY